jgi:SAM-dependent methyltransferase
MHGSKTAPPRSVELELLDQSDLSPRELSTSLRDVGRLNRWFGGTRAVVAEVGRVCKERGLAGRVSVLDIGTGGADIPRALVGWGQRRGITFEIVACDRHEQVVALAAEFSSGHESITVLRADALAPPFLHRSFDFVTCSLLIHHMEEDEVISLLEKLRHLPRHAVIACDLERSDRGRAGVWLATRLVCRSRLSRHDGPLSVLRSYTLEELSERSRRAGCGEMRWSRRSFYRVVGVLEK